MDNPNTPAYSLSRSLKRRVGLLSLIGTLGLIVTIVLGLLLTLSNVTANMNDVKNNAVNAFDLFFLEIKSDLLATSEGLASREDINADLLTLRIRNNAFLDVLYVLPDGTISAQRNAVGRPHIETIDQKEWLEYPPTFGETKISSIGFEEQIPYVDIATSVTDDIGLPAGILLVRVDLTKLWNTTLDIKVGDTGYAYIVDHEGQLVAFRNRRLLESGSYLQALIGHTPQEIASSPLNLYSSINKEFVLGGAQPLEMVPWFAIVEQSVGEALAPFFLTGCLLLLSIGLVGFVLLNTLRFTDQRIVSPLLSLRDIVMQMELGKSEQMLNVRYNDELGQVGEAVNHMAEKIRSQTKVLQESDARYRLIADNTADVIWVMDVETMRFTYVSPSVKKLRGYTPEEVMTQPVSEALTPESAKMVEEAMSTWIPRFIEDPSVPLSLVSEVDQPCKDGSIVNTEVTTTYVLNEQGKLEIVGVSRNITKRKQTEEALKESEAKLSAIFNNSRDAIGVSKEGIHTLVNPAYANMFGYENPHELVGMSILDLIAPEGRPEILENVRRRALGEPVPNFYETTAMHKDGTTFLMEVNASTYTIVDETNTLVILRDITERNKAETELRQSEARFRALVEHAPEAIVVLDVAKGVYVDANENACEFYKLSRDELLTKGPAELSPPFQADGRSSTELAHDVVQRALEGENPRFEWIHLDSQGREVPCEVNLTRLPSSTGWLIRGSLTDITERKRAEEKLLERERFLEAIIENIPDMIFVKDAQELRFTQFNKAGEQLLGFTRQELLGKNDYDFFPKEQADFFIQKDREVLESKGVQDIPEEPINTKTGARTIHTKKIPICDADGKPVYLLGISEDITERKRAEEALRESEERFRSFMAYTPIFAYIKDQTLTHIYMNPATERILSNSKLGEVKTQDFFERSLAERLEIADRKILDGISDFEELEYTAEIHGQTVWLQDIKFPIILSDGMRFVGGVSIDITERKQAEIQLQEQLNELRRWHNITIGREERILDLKREINDLLVKTGQPPRYQSADDIQ